MLYGSNTSAYLFGMLIVYLVLIQNYLGLCEIMVCCCCVWGSDLLAVLTTKIVVVRAPWAGAKDLNYHHPQTADIKQARYCNCISVHWTSTGHPLCPGETGTNSVLTRLGSTVTLFFYLIRAAVCFQDQLISQEEPLRENCEHTGITTPYRKRCSPRDKHCLVHLNVSLISKGSK